MEHLSKAISGDAEGALIPVPAPVSRDLAEVQRVARERVRELLDASVAPNTKTAYASDWKHFEAWCAALGIAALPASVDTVISYLSELPTMEHSARHGRGTRKQTKAGYSVATIERRLASIATRHKLTGHENPCAHEHVHQVLCGIRRTTGVAPRRKAAMLTEHLRRLRRVGDDSLQARRDRALLLVGFSGAFRRSELIGIDVEHCQFAERTLTITLLKSKTDQEQRGRKVVIHAGGALCPIAALRAWLDAAQITTGAVFRSFRKGGAMGGRLSTEGAALIIKRYANAVGLDSAEYAGHSLRAGHVTQAILRGESAHAIMAMTGHASRAMVDRYFRDVEPLRHNSSANLGL
jgi:site-specific recombinase XerD